MITFMMAREVSSRAYPEIGVPDPHHPLSHHQGDVEKIAKVEKVNTYHVQTFAYYLDKLRSTADGDGTLLDNTMILYGSGMGDGNTHSHHNLPVLLVGGGAGQLRGGRHIRYKGHSAHEPLREHAGQAGHSDGSLRRQHRSGAASG